MSKLWECMHCGRACLADPGQIQRVEEAECGYCGAEMMPVPDDPADVPDDPDAIWDFFIGDMAGMIGAAAADAERQRQGRDSN